MENYCQNNSPILQNHSFYFIFFGNYFLEKKIYFSKINRKSPIPQWAGNFVKVFGGQLRVEPEIPENLNETIEENWEILENTANRLIFLILGKFCLVKFFAIFGAHLLLL